MLKLKLCGLSQSICLAVLSAWGIIQLGTMGVLYHIKSVSLFEDLPHDEEEIEHAGVNTDLSHFYKHIDKEYEEV